VKNAGHIIFKVLNSSKCYWYSSLLCRSYRNSCKIWFVFYFTGACCSLTCYTSRNHVCFYKSSWRFAKQSVQTQLRDLQKKYGGCSKFLITREQQLLSEMKVWYPQEFSSEFTVRKFSWWLWQLRCLIQFFFSLLWGLLHNYNSIYSLIPCWVCLVLFLFKTPKREAKARTALERSLLLPFSESVKWVQEPI